MVKIPYCDSNGILTAEVILKNQSNVFLLDQTNYNRYRQGQSFNYHGGYYKQNPVRITVKGVKRWYLIVENSACSYRFIWNELDVDFYILFIYLKIFF